jgi:hypothetical protein
MIRKSDTSIRTGQYRRRPCSLRNSIVVERSADNALEDGKGLIKKIA